jgi:hypothetical protein
MFRFYDKVSLLHADNPFRLPQHNLHLPGVFLGALGYGDRKLGWPNAFQVYDSTFRFRHNLLGDDENVALGNVSPLAAACLSDQSCKIGSAPDQW